MLLKKSYDMVLWFLVKNNWKHFENFLHFLFKNFQTYFSGITSWKNIENVTFDFIQICPRFISPLLFILWIIIFATKLQLSRNPSKLYFIKDYKLILLPEFAKLVSRPIHHLKKYFFRFAKISNVFKNFQFWRRNRTKTN
jgi:hypothetical protein